MAADAAAAAASLSSSSKNYFYFCFVIVIVSRTSYLCPRKRLNRICLEPLGIFENNFKFTGGIRRRLRSRVVQIEICHWHYLGNREGSVSAHSVILFRLRFFGCAFFLLLVSAGAVERTPGISGAPLPEPACEPAMTWSPVKVVSSPPEIIWMPKHHRKLAPHEHKLVRYIFKPFSVLSRVRLGTSTKRFLVSACLMNKRTAQGIADRRAG